MLRLRYIPPEGALVEVTTRTQHGRLLLRPHPDLNEIVRGILARAQRLYFPPGAGLVAFCFLSNHYHLLLRVQNAGQLSAFMRYVNSNLAREVGRLVDWRDHVWSRRYQAIVVSEEPEAQEARLRYLLCQGVKEGLVGHPAEWPGAQSVRALLEGQPIEGYWFDRSKEYFARRRGEDFGRLRYATTESLTLLPIPCWDSLPVDRQRDRVHHLIAEIEATYRDLRRGQPPLGVERILKQRPHDLPVKSKRSPAPWFHTSTRETGQALRAAYRAFAGAYRRAARQLRSGDREAPFPEGSFPPALPFVGG